MNNNILSAEKELVLINNHTRTPLTADDVYTFTLTLCDNEIDRDFECFSLKSIEKLCELFVGKTGIADHSMLAKDQTARIFYCYTETDPTKKTTKGEAYTALKARAYTLRNESNKDFHKIKNRKICRGALPRKYQSAGYRHAFILFRFTNFPIHKKILWAFPCKLYKLYSLAPSGNTTALFK